MFCANGGVSPTGQYKSYPSPSAQALHSGNILPIDQTQDRQETVPDIQTELSNVDNEIARAQAVLNRLKLERQRLHESLTHSQSLVAPIRSLPAEVLSEVFMAVPRNEPFSISNSPVLFTRVCSQWRDVAISTPQLWDVVNFIVDGTLNVKPFTMEFWKLWLSRSGACPLKIKVDLSRRALPRFSYCPIMDMLLSCSHRWFDACITAPFSLDTFAAVKAQFPILTNLTIASSSFSVSPGSLAMFEAAPRLQTVLLVSPFGFSAQCGLPWMRLQSFVGDLPIDDCLTILTLCSHLTNCRLQCRRSAHIPTCSLILPNLQELRVSIVDNVVCECLFDSLTCPALNRLRIRPLSRLSFTLPPSTLTSFIARSSCVLQELSLRGISLKDPGLIVFLEELPSLIELELSEANDPTSCLPTVPWHLFDRMTYDSRSTAEDHPALLVPKLKVLELNMRFTPPCDIIPKMIQSRWDLVADADANSTAQSVTRIESVQLELRHMAVCEHFERMKRWQEDGLDIDITVDDEDWL